MIRVQSDTSGARKYLSDLQQREIPRVIGRTLNRTASSVMSRASREMRTRVNLKKAVIDKAISKRRSNEIQTLTALGLGRAWFEIRYSGKPFGIRDFDARETAKGVTFKVARIGRRKLYVRKGNKGFIVDKFGGHIFTRIGEGRQIKKASGPSIPQFAATKRVQASLIQYAQEFWARELERNIKYTISRRKGA